MDIAGIMGVAIRLAGLLSPAHARAVSEYMIDSVVGLGEGEELENALASLIATITNEMVQGPIAAAEALGATAMIGVYLPDGEDVRERDDIFGDVRFTVDDEGFGRFTL